MPDDISITWTCDRPELVINGATWICRPQEGAPAETRWHFPVGEGDYSPERWYCSVWHSLDGSLNANGYKHTGIDLNLDVSPWGDVERALNLSIFAIAEGIVTYRTQDWSGVPMIVIRHMHDGQPLFVRYGHVSPVVHVGHEVFSGQRLGGFANWRKGDGGDHLHFDMALDPFTREWLDPDIRWLGPVPALKEHLNSAKVDAMLRRG